MDPSFLGRAFSDEIAGLTHFMPHLHVSLQSGCSRTLAAMRRKYNSGTALRNLTYLKERILSMRFSADIIAGFPGETDEDFAETLRFARNAGFLHIHIFTYSVRPGTEAAGMPDQIPEAIKNERAAVLASLQRDIKKGLLDRTIADGKIARVLFETYKDGRVRGHAEDFTEYTIAGDRNLYGQIQNVIPLSRSGDIIEGKII
jgi:threonylcarbamoyladenosine tRNA methylthiotransferase MtaB